MRDDARTWRALAVVGVLIGLLSGCASIPDSGPVRTVTKRAPATKPLEQQDIRLLPPGPQPQAAPRDIVEGFYLAMSDVSDGTYAAAREYLAPEIRQSWRPRDAPTTIYDRHEVRADGVVPGKFTVRLFRVAEIGTDNGYTRVSGVRDDAVELARVDGEWRITRPPAGLALPLVNAQRVLRAVDVFFMGAVDHLLVPDRVTLQVAGSSLPRELVDQLVRGPTAWLGGAVYPVTPPGTVVRSVTVDGNGTATVDLGGAATALRGTSLTDLEAALALTLDQLNGDVERTQLRFDGHAVGQPFSADTFAAYTGVVATPAYFVDAGRLRVLSETDLPAQPSAPYIEGLSSPAVAATRVAALVKEKERGRAEVSLVLTRVGTLSDQPAVLLKAPRLTRPSWSPGGEAVWTVATYGKHQQRLWRVTPDGKPARVSLTPAPGMHDVTVFEVSRDGARVALVAASATGVPGVWIGRIVPSGNGYAVEGVRPISPDSIGTPIDISWASADSVAVLTRQGDGSTAAYALDVDGSGNRPVGVSVVAPRATQIAAAPGRPWLVSAVDGAIYEQQGLSWRRVHSGTCPTYPL